MKHCASVILSPHFFSYPQGLCGQRVSSLLLQKQLLVL